MHLFKIQLIPNLLQKSKILQEMHLKSVYYSKYIVTVDIGLLWRLSAPSLADREKGDGQSTHGKTMGKKFLK